ncbi:MAG: hypothetical protein AAGA08_07960 [Pseudomonadota bacterium]
MKIGFIGDAFDPTAQLFAAHMTELGAEVFPVHSINSAEAVDRYACGSTEAFLAIASSLISARKPVTLLLRRRAASEDQVEFTRRLQLLAAVLSNAPQLEITLMALNDAVAKTLKLIVGRDITVLPPVIVTGGERQTAILDAVARTIQFGDDASCTCDADAVSWLRVSAKARIVAPKELDTHNADLIAYANNCTQRAAQSVARYEPPLILFIVVNGVGLGHLTRLLAIAEQLRKSAQARVAFWCYSRAASILEAHGFEVIQRMTWQHLNVEKSAWEVWETADFARLFRDFAPAGVVYDGAAVPASLTNALRMVGTPPIALTWLRRAMWQNHTNPEYLQAAQHCDLIIEPDDFAATADKGPTTWQQTSHRGSAEFLRVPAIGLTTKSDMLTRRQARRKLGLQLRKRTCLISLGGDAFGRCATAMQLIEETANTAQIELVIARSPLASTADQDSNGPRSISVFPLGRYLSAFDGIISAAGYNSFHEMLALTDVPLMFVPTIHARLDDQNARAEFACEKGWSLSLPQSGVSQQRDTLAKFWDAVSQRSKRPSPEMDQTSARKTADLLAERIR